MEEKLKTTKIISANNTPDKRIISKILFEYTNELPPSRKNSGLHAQICTKYCTKAFDRAYSAPLTPWLD